MSKAQITNYELRITDHLSDDLHFLIACCQAEPTQKDIDLIRTYLSQNDTTRPSRHSGLDPESTQSQSDKHQNLLALANRHGILPLVYKTLKRLSEEGLLRDTSDVNRNTDNFHPSSHSGPDPESKESQSHSPSSSTPIGDPQPQSDNTHPSRHSGHDPESTQSQSDKHQNLILLANRHGVLPLVYKTLKRLSEEGLLRDSRPVPLSSSSTPLGDPQSQSDTNHESRITDYELPISRYNHLCKQVHRLPTFSLTSCASSSPAARQNRRRIWH